MKYDEPIFSKNRITTTRYFLHQRFASRRPWAAPADLSLKRTYLILNYLHVELPRKLLLQIINGKKKSWMSQIRRLHSKKIITSTYSFGAKNFTKPENRNLEKTRGVAS